MDDIDHLGSRRRPHVGKCRQPSRCRLARTERLKERMTLFDQGIDPCPPQKLINPKALSAGVIRDFFGAASFAIQGPDQPVLPS